MQIMSLLTVTNVLLFFWITMIILIVVLNLKTLTVRSEECNVQSVPSATEMMADGKFYYYVLRKPVSKIYLRSRSKMTKIRNQNRVRVAKGL